MKSNQFAKSVAIVDLYWYDTISRLYYRKTFPSSRFCVQTFSICSLPDGKKHDIFMSMLQKKNR